MNRFHPNKRVKIVGFTLLGIILLYTCLGFFLAPVLVKKNLTKQLEALTNRAVSMGDVAVNPYALTLEIQNFAVKKRDNPQENFISFARVFGNLSLSSLFRLAPVISELTLEKPEVSIVLNPDSSFNFSDLMEEAAPDPSVDQSDSGPFGFSLANVRIAKGGIEFSDRIRGVIHKIEDLEIYLPLLSSLEKDRNTPAKMDIGFVLNRAGIQIQIQSFPFTAGLDTDIKLGISSMDLTTYLPYVPVPEGLEVKTMNLGLDVQAAYSQSGKDTQSLVLKGKAGLDHINIQEKDASPVLDLPELSLVISPSDLFKGQVTLEKILLKSPDLHVHRDSQGMVNLAAYFGVPGQESIPPESAEMKDSDGTADQTEVKKDMPDAGSSLPEFVFTLVHGEIRKAVLDFSDESTASPFQTHISPLDMEVKNLVAKSRDQAISGEYSLSLETEAKETLSVGGSFANHPLQVDGSVQLGDLALKKYTPYYQGLVGFDIQDGRLTLDTQVQVSEKPPEGEINLNLETKEILVKALKIGDRINKDSPVEIPEIKIAGTRFDLSEKKVDLGKIVTSSGNVTVLRQPDGSINLAANLMGSSGTTGTGSGPEKLSDSQSEAGGSWDISLASLDLSGYTVNFKDMTNTEPVSIALSGIQFRASDLGTAVTRNGEIEFLADWNKNGRIKAKGDFVLPTLRAGLDISLQDIDVNSLEPYFTDSVKIMITSGLANVEGRLGLDLKNKAGQMVSFKGDTFLNDFLSLDKASANDFFQCDSLYVSGIDVSLFPVKVAVDDISLTDFYSRFIVSDKGEINIQQIFTQAENKDEPKPAKAKEEARSEDQARPEISVADITLQGGRIEFSDYLTQPNFTANMKEIAGSLKGLSSLDTEPARLNLQGIHGTSSPLKISGSVSPLTPKKSADINVSFRDIELAKFTPYSSKYLGYKIAKGKLVLDLNYRIDGNRLDSKNRLFFDQFTLGEKTDSKDATSLPVALAISLLTNQDGRIDLDLPVQGDLNDPKFRFGSVVLKVISNLILKAVTAPFSILGSIFGGGEKLGYVEFLHGQDQIDEENRLSLDKLVDILVKKPSLNLEILGMYDPVRDAQALAAIRLEDLFKSMKLKRAGKTAQDIKSLKEVVIQPQEREALIQSAYEKAEFPKPKENDGKEKEISVPEQEKLLLTHIQVSESDLKLLAMARAENVKAYILSTQLIPPERLFLLDPSPVNAETGNDRVVKVKFSFK